MKCTVTNVTLNGEPLEVFFAIREAVEAEKARRAEVKAASIPTPAPRTKRRGNISGARSGKCRILYSASDSRWVNTTPEQAIALDKLARIGGAL